MRQTVKTILRHFGYKISHIASQPQQLDPRVFDCQSPGFMRLLNLHGVDLVFDVGANVGGYAQMLLSLGYAGRIVSFEPSSSAYTHLLQASAGHPRWTVAERCAIGDKIGQVALNIAANSESSSILPMLDSHLQAAPESRYTSSEMVKLETLDILLPMYLQEAKSPFLKIDVQGFEQQVLDGARQTLSRIQGIQIELSLIPLYDQQATFRQLIDQLEAEGFDLYALLPGFTDPRTGRMLQCDGVFFRSTQHGA